MIDVDIIKNDGLIALCTITGDEYEFRGDLERIKSIPFGDRDFVSRAEPKYWRIRNAEIYCDQVVEIGDAIKTHKMQLKMFD